jgi:hypothetical protein
MFLTTILLTIGLGQSPTWQDPEITQMGNEAPCASFTPFTLPAEWQGMQVFLEFGAAKTAFISRVNGRMVGKEDGPSHSTRLYRREKEPGPGVARVSETVADVVLHNLK